MTKATVTIHNIETGEVINREMNAEELAQHKIDLAEHAQRQAEATAKAATRQAVLDKLGLTAEEMAALLS